MTTPTQLKTGTLGTRATFAGEAARTMRGIYPFLSEPRFFPSMPACWQAVETGAVEVLIIGVERTGQPHQGHAIIKSGLHVIGQLALPLACNLYVKPGTKREAIRRITGHGSVHQCEPYLERHFPGVPRVAHELNSVAAARELLTGDGSAAVVGTKSLQEEVPGLERLEENIDEGSAFASWWAITRQPLFDENPDFIVATLRGGPDGSLGRLIEAVARQGFSTRAVGAFPVFSGLSVYDYLLTWTGRGTLKGVREAVASVNNVRLAGAFRSG